MAEVANAYVSLLPSARGFGKGIQAEIGGDLDRAGREGGKRLGSGIGGSALVAAKSFVGPLAAVFAGASIAGFFKDAVTGASDLSETTSKVGQVFGSAAGDIERFAAGAATALGQTRQQALDANATFGVFGKSAGLSGKALTGFTTELTTLATDMASFSNTSPEQAIAAIGAALRGESEPIRQYGVLLDDASLRQEALKQGLIETTKQALTPQQKVLASQALILKQTALQQGDFARTSGGLANQQRILSAQWANMKANLGAGLLPVVTRAVTFFNSLFSASSPLAPLLERVKAAVAPLAAAFTGAGTGSSALSGALDAVKAAFASIMPTLLKFGQQIMAVLGPAIHSIGGIVTGQLLPAFAAFLPAVTPIVRFFLNVFGGAVVGALKGVVNVVKGVLTAISGIMNVFAGILKGDWSRAWQGVKQIFSGAFTALKGAVQVFLNVGVLGIFRKGFALLKSLAQAGWNGLKSLFSASMSAIGSLLGRLPGILRGAFTSAFGAARSAVSTGISTVLSFFRALPGRIVSALGSLGSALYGVGKNIVQGLVNGVRSMAGALKDALLRLLPGPLAKFAGALGINSPSTVFAGYGRNIGEGLIVGVQSQQHAVERAIAQLAVTPALPRRGVQVGVAAPGATSAAGSAITVIQNYPPATPERAIRHAVGDALALAGR